MLILMIEKYHKKYQIFSHRASSSPSSPDDLNQTIKPIKEDEVFLYMVKNIKLLEKTKRQTREKKDEIWRGNSDICFKK